MEKQRIERINAYKARIAAQRARYEKLRSDAKKAKTDKEKIDVLWRSHYGP